MIKLEKDENLTLDCGTSTDTTFYIQSLSGKKITSRAKKLNAESVIVLEGPAELLFFSASQNDTGSIEIVIAVESNGVVCPIYSHSVHQGGSVIISRQSIFSVISGKVNA